MPEPSLETAPYGVISRNDSGMWYLDSIGSWLGSHVVLSCLLFLKLSIGCDCFGRGCPDFVSVAVLRLDEGFAVDHDPVKHTFLLILGILAVH